MVGRRFNGRVWRYKAFCKLKCDCDAHIPFVSPIRLILHSQTRNPFVQQYIIDRELARGMNVWFPSCVSSSTVVTMRTAKKFLYQTQSFPRDAFIFTVNMEHRSPSFRDGFREHSSLRVRFALTSNSRSFTNTAPNSPPTSPYKSSLNIKTCKPTKT